MIVGVESPFRRDFATFFVFASSFGSVSNLNGVLEDRFYLFFPPPIFVTLHRFCSVFPTFFARFGYFFDCDSSFGKSLFLLFLVFHASFVLKSHFLIFTIIGTVYDLKS